MITDILHPNGPTEQVVAPSIKEQILGKIAISSGYDDQDYVIHFSTIDSRIPFKVNEKVLLMSVINILRKVIPSEIKVDIWTPQIGWDLKVYTVKAYGLGKCWQVSDALLEKTVKELFVELNQKI